MRKVKVVITEEREGWDAAWHDGTTKSYRAAADALAAVRKVGHRWADAGMSSAILIEWQPTTPLGRCIVRVLTALDAKKRGKETT